MQDANQPIETDPLRVARQIQVLINDLRSTPPNGRVEAIAFLRVCLGERLFDAVEPMVHATSFGGELPLTDKEKFRLTLIGKYGNIAAASAALGISVKTAYKRLKRYGLHGLREELRLGRRGEGESEAEPQP